MAKQAQSAAAPVISFTPEQLQAYVDQAITKVLEVKQAHEEHKRSDEMETATVKAFRRAGYKPEDIKPRENIKTYNLWIAEGRRVRQGESSIRVRTLRLFHIDQTSAMNEVEKKAAVEALAEKRAKRTSDVLPKPSPVNPAPVAARPKAGKVIITEHGNA
jgi:hypothetical protein